jgi:predicted DNA-binding transcriptional regulator AlpA
MGDTQLVDSLLRIKDVAALAAICEREVYKLIAAGKAPEVIHLGRAARMRRSDVSLWLRLGCPSRDALEAAKGGVDE